MAASLAWDANTNEKKEEELSSNDRVIDARWGWEEKRTAGTQEH